MAFSTTLLSWGIINYQTAYNDAKQLKMAYTQITWTLDYFVKCHKKVKIEIHSKFWSKIATKSKTD